MRSPENVLAKQILSLGDGTTLPFADFCNGGCIITGDSGSGKTSTSLKAILFGMLLANLGIVYHPTKASDTPEFLDYVRKAKREQDVIVFNEKSGLTFDSIAYEWGGRSGARGGGDTEAIIDYFDTLTSIGKPHSASGEGRFWDLAAQQAIRHAIHLIQLAAEVLSIVNIYRAISSFPNYLGEEETQQWQERYTGSLIKRVESRKHLLTEDDWQDAETIGDFIFVRWATFDERPRSSVAMTIAGLADKFTLNPFRKLFASGSYSFTPEQVTHERKIIIIDFPILEYGQETARLIQTMIKLTFQRAWLRHPYKPGCCNGGCIVQDEFQTLMSRFESRFAQTVRASAIASLYVTQSITNLAEEMGESQPGSKTRAFLNNLGLRIAHRSTCPDTCSYFADVVGKTWRFIPSFNGGGGPDSGPTVSGSSQLVHTLEPTELSRLERPSIHSPLAAAYVYRGGDVFPSTKTERNPRGSNFLKVFFSRD